MTNRAELHVEDVDRPVKFSFPDPEPMRFPGAILSATNVSFAYPDSKTKVLDNITLTIQPGDRVGLVGQNGGDKSTLVKILIGVLRPQTDTIDRHPRLRLGYFDQHFVEILSAPEVASLSALEFFMEQLKGKHPNR